MKEIAMRAKQLLISGGLSLILICCSLQPSTAESKEVSTESDEVAKLLRKRLDVLREIVKIQRAAYMMGQVRFDAVVKSQIDVLDAQIELAKSPIERIAIRKNLVQQAMQMEKFTKQLFDGMQAGRADLLKAQAFRLRAQADLKRETLDNKKRPKK